MRYYIVFLRQYLPPTLLLLKGYRKFVLRIQPKCWVLQIAILENDYSNSSEHKPLFIPIGLYFIKRHVWKVKIFHKNINNAWNLFNLSKQSPLILFHDFQLIKNYFLKGYRKFVPKIQPKCWVLQIAILENDYSNSSEHKPLFIPIGLYFIKRHVWRVKNFHKNVNNAWNLFNLSKLSPLILFHDFQLVENYFQSIECSFWLIE